jgi:hypothetical protein
MKLIHKIQSAILLSLFCILGLFTGCNEDVAMASAYINLSTDSIFAPALASSFSVEIDANCEWEIDYEGNETRWAWVNLEESTGTSDVLLSVEANNGSASRQVILTISNKSGSAVKKLVLTQSTFSTEGYISIPDMRTLALNGTYKFENGAKMKGITVSNQRYGNFFENCIAIESSLEPNNGIVIRGNSTFLVSPGEEVEIDLTGASVARNRESGLIEVIVSDNSNVARTETTRITPTAIPLTAEELLSGGYESMYVSVTGQVKQTDLSKSTLSGTLEMQNEEGKSYNMTVLESCSFASNSIPSGSGTISGIVATAEETYGIMPTSIDDLVLNNSRFDGGVTFPYIFSFMCLGANMTPKYLSFVASSDPNDCYGYNDDGTGATISFNLNSASKYINMWAENSGHHNIPIGSWAGGKGVHYVQLEYPMGEDIDGGIRLSFGLNSQKNAPKNWVIQYSTDKSTWYDAEDAPNVVLPYGKTYGSGIYYFYHVVDFKPEIPIKRKQTLYIRITPYDEVSVSNGALSGSYGRISLHSCIVIEHIPAYSTTKPADAIYYEPFDICTQGLDYRNGDYLCGMMNFCGDEISNWTTTNGLTGLNVHQRPGYAQIGYVETQEVAQTKYTNTIGALNTPKLGATGTLNLSFKAMAYKNKSVYNVGTNTALDINGDITDGVIEVVGGGTINGSTSVIVSGLSYDSFKLYNYTINGATSDTYLRFTSNPDEGEFSRWFIDEIYVTK